jgi:TonB family protein
MISAALLALAASVASPPPLPAGPVPTVRPDGDARAALAAAGDAREARRRDQREVVFEVTVSPRGAVSDCRILQSSGSAQLDDQACTIARGRPRLAWARDAQGRARPESVRRIVSWSIPRHPLVLLNPRSAEPPRLAGRGYER